MGGKTNPTRMPGIVVQYGSSCQLPASDVKFQSAVLDREIPPRPFPGPPQETKVPLMEEGGILSHKANERCFSPPIPLKPFAETCSPEPLSRRARPTLPKTRSDSETPTRVAFREPTESKAWLPVVSSKDHQEDRPSCEGKLHTPRMNGITSEQAVVISGILLQAIE